MAHNLEQDASDSEDWRFSFGVADVSVILDTSIFDQWEQFYMTQFSAALANRMDIWTTLIKNHKAGSKEEKLVEGGSRIEVVDGR